MSGHSKWATIKRAKAVNDAKRGNIFTKLGNNITVAAREGGGDALANFKLRLAMEKARQANMPKENIERAVKRGTGELKGEIIEELMYGAILSGNVAVVIKCVTDNKNRSLNEIKTAVQKNGGQITDLHSVLWQFEHKGVIHIDKKCSADKKYGEIEMAIIESGADDYAMDKDDEIVVYTKVEDLKDVRESLEKNGVMADTADLEMVAKEPIEVDEENIKKIEKVLSALDELDDVSDYYTNLK